MKDLPGEVENLILAVPPGLSGEIVEQCIGTGIKRVWIVKGIRKTIGKLPSEFQLAVN